MADPGEGGEGPGRAEAPLFLDQTEARRAEIKFMETAVSPTPPPSYVRVWMTEPPLSQGLDLALNSYSGHKSFSKPNEKPKPEGQNYRGAHANMDYLGGGGGGEGVYSPIHE